MSPLIKYALIFGVIGAAIGALLAPVFIPMALSCGGLATAGGEVYACSINPNSFMLLGAILGFVAGAAVGIVFWKLNTKMQKKQTAAA
jgi:uncharacterized membrane-anchored protein YhcB (DUF1043 family)